jgi:sulfate permease, SulP family
VGFSELRFERNKTGVASVLGRYVPLFRWLPRYGGDQLGGDLTAGIVVAVMLVPQSMAYAMLAGLPPQVGLYASILPLVIYGMLGTSRSLAVGPVAILSLMTATSVGALAPEGSREFIALALALAFLAGLIQLGLGLIRAGFLVSFLSHPVLSGFINAAALMIAASQVRHLLGLEGGRGETFAGMLGGIITHLTTLNPVTTLLGAGSVAALWYFRASAAGHLRLLGLPAVAAGMAAKAGPLVVVMIATVLTWALALPTRSGVSVVGSIPSGLPPLGAPDLDLGTARALLPAAIVLSLVGFMESISVAKSLASRRRERVDADQELIALGAANLGAAFSGGYPVTGGLSRSAVNDAAGARSGMASIFTALVVLLTVGFFTPLFTYLPQAVLAAIVVVAVSGLFETRTLRRAWAVNRADAAVLAVTFVAVLARGIEIGLLAGIAASLAIHLWRTSRPHVAEVGRLGDSEIYRNVLRHPARTCPHAVVLRIDESLYFANAKRLEDAVLSAVARRPEVRCVVLVGTAINDVDTSAMETLESLVLELRAAGVEIHLAAFKGPVLDRLRNTTLLRLLGPSRVHGTTHDAMREIGCA